MSSIVFAASRPPYNRCTASRKTYRGHCIRPLWSGIDLQAELYSCGLSSLWESTFEIWGIEPNIVYQELGQTALYHLQLPSLPPPLSSTRVTGSARVYIYVFQMTSFRLKSSTARIRSRAKLSTGRSDSPSMALRLAQGIVLNLGSPPPSPTIAGKFHPHEYHDSSPRALPPDRESANINGQLPDYFVMIAVLVGAPLQNLTAWAPVLRGRRSILPKRLTQRHRMSIEPS